MLLFPKKPKYLKSYSNRRTQPNSTKNNSILRFSQVSLVAAQHGFIPNFQIEAVRLFLRRLLRKRAQLFFRFFPNQPITKKPNEVRLGRGKGAFKYWSFFAKKGSTLIEVSGYNKKIVMLALMSVRYKIGIKSYVYNKQFRWIL